MPLPDTTIPIASTDDVQEKTVSQILNDLHKENARGVYDACMVSINQIRDLLTRISDFMRRCNPDRLKPGEEQASADEWISIEAEVNAAIGDPTAPAPATPPSADATTLDQVIADIAAELGCEPDKQEIIERIQIMKQLFGDLNESDHG